MAPYSELGPGRRQPLNLSLNQGFDMKSNHGPVVIEVRVVGSDREGGNESAPAILQNAGDKSGVKLSVHPDEPAKVLARLRHNDMTLLLPRASARNIRAQQAPRWGLSRLIGLHKLGEQSHRQQE